MALLVFAFLFSFYPGVWKVGNGMYGVIWRDDFDRDDDEAPRICK